MSLNIRESEKNPGQRLIDHPSFMDVYETTFVKGVITEFKSESRPKTGGVSPIDQVESMVKVLLDEGGETDYLPLFYRPKEGYWDWLDAVSNDVGGWIEHNLGGHHFGPGQVSEDFDKEKYFYKSAWMSFRVGDEVIVFCQKGEPKAVIGFYDNYPRIGEKLIKLSDDKGTEYIEVSNVGGIAYWDYSKDCPATKGPDGEELGLELEAELLHSKDTFETGEGGEDISFEGWVTLLSPNAEFCGSLYKSGMIDIQIKVEGTSFAKYTTKEYKAIVGPYIYVITLDILYYNQGLVTEKYYYRKDHTVEWEDKEYLCTESSGGQSGTYLAGCHIYGAIYDEKKHDNLKPSEITIGLGPNKYPDEFKDLGGVSREVFLVDAKVYIHPHTKEELKATGLWPEFGE